MKIPAELLRESGTEILSSTAATEICDLEAISIGLGAVDEAIKLTFDTLSASLLVELVVELPREFSRVVVALVITLVLMLSISLKLKGANDFSRINFLMVSVQVLGFSAQAFKVVRSLQYSGLEGVGANVPSTAWTTVDSRVKRSQDFCSISLQCFMTSSAALVLT